MLCFWKGKGTKAFPLWQRAIYEENVNFYWSISRAPRQWQGAMEAIASVASVKYQAWSKCTQLHETRVFFSFIIFSQVRWPIELKCAQVCHFMHVEIHQLLKASLWQLPIVSTALKTNIRWFIFGMYTLYKSMKSSQFWLVRTALWMWKYLQISQRYDQLFAHFPVEPRVVHWFV